MECILSGLLCMDVSVKVKKDKKTEQESVYRVVSLYMPGVEGNEYSESDLKKVNIPDTKEGVDLFNYFKNNKMKEVCIFAEYEPERLVRYKSKDTGKQEEMNFKERFDIKSIVDESSIKMVDLKNVKVAA